MSDPLREAAEAVCAHCEPDGLEPFLLSLSASAQLELVQTWLIELQARADNLRAALGSGGWVSTEKKLPDETGRYLIWYRYKNGPIEKPFIGDWDAFEQRWATGMIDVEILYWATIAPPQERG